MEIVRLTPDQWQEFRTVRLASLAESPSAFGSRYADWVDAHEQRWRTRLTEVPFTLVARADGGPVGVVSGVGQDDAWVELISLWVDPGHRGTGLVERLVQGVVDWAQQQGRPTFLMVRQDNARARRAYERIGFVDKGVPAGWPAGEPLEHRMELPH